MRYQEKNFMSFRELMEDAEELLAGHGYLVEGSENILAFRRDGDIEGAFFYLAAHEFATGPYVLDPLSGIVCLVYDVVPYSQGRGVSSYNGLAKDRRMAEHLVDSARIAHDLRFASDMP